jgi:hypothetical protein
VTHPFHPLRGRRLRVLFERKLVSGVVVHCEGGPLGSVQLAVAWTDWGLPPAEKPLTYEVLADLAAEVLAVRSGHGG